MDAQRHRLPGARLRSALATAAGLVLMVAGYFTLPLDWFGPDHPALSWVAFGVALASLSVLLTRQIWRVLTGTDRGWPAGVIILLICLSLVIFASSYLALARQPGEFDNLHTRIDSLYFTVVTLATIGYGDITASGQTARVVVLVQIFYNFVFLTAAASALTRQLRGRINVRLQDRGSPGALPPEPPGPLGPPEPPGPLGPPGSAGPPGPWERG